LAIFLIFVAWDLFLWVTKLPAYVIPRPEAALGIIFHDWAVFSPLLWQTVTETVWGYIIGAVVGVVLAVLMSLIRPVQRLVYPALVTSQAVPIVAVAAPLAIIFGFGMTPKLIIVAWIVFFPVAVNVLDGLASVDKDILNLARVLGGSQLRIFLVVRLPACLGSLFTGLKIAASYAVTGAVIGEWTASNSVGLGTYLLSANASMNTAGVYAAVLLLTAIGILSFVLTLGVEVIAMPWRWRSTKPYLFKRHINPPATQTTKPKELTE